MDFIYNGVKSEKRALFQNPVSELDLTPSKDPPKGLEAPETMPATLAPKYLQVLRMALSIGWISPDVTRPVGDDQS